jgi:hypothetical protein
MNVDRALSQPPLPLLSAETTTSNSRSEPIASMTRRRPFSAAWWKASWVDPSR